MVGGDRKEEGGCYMKREGSCQWDLGIGSFSCRVRSRFTTSGDFQKGYWLCFTRAIFYMKVISGIVVKQRALSIHKCGLCL